MYGQGNHGSQFSHTYPAPPLPSYQAPAASSQPPFQQAPPTGASPPPLRPFFPHPVSNQNPPPSTMYSQPLPPSQAAHARQPLLHMNAPPSNYASNPRFPMPTGNQNDPFIPPPAFPSPRVLPPLGFSTSNQFLYRNPHPPPPGIHHAPPSFGTVIPPLSEAPLPSLPPDSPPPPPPPPSPPPSSPSPPPNTQVTEIQEMPKQEIAKDLELDKDIIHGDKAIDIDLECSEEREEPPGHHSPPPTRPAEDVVHNIETLCKFMVNVGPQFESLAREKEANNPSFSFLFGGAPGSAAAIGFDYFMWMKKKHHLESHPSEHDSLIQVPALPPKSTVDVKPASPSESDMDMDDDACHPQESQGISELNKQSNNEVTSEPDSEDQFDERSNDSKESKSEMPSADFLPGPSSSSHDQEVHDVEKTPARHSSTFPYEDASAVHAPLVHSEKQEVEAPPVCINDGSPFGLIKDYAFEDSEDDDVNGMNASDVIKDSQHGEINEDEKRPFKDQSSESHGEKHGTKDSSLRVDEFGRILKEDESSSGSEGTYAERQYVRRGRSRSRSWSRSQSPQERGRQTRSPWGWRERQSRSPSWSPRGHGRQWDQHQRQGRGPPPECFNFLKGRCYRGASCWYSHHDLGRPRNRHQDFRNISHDSKHVRREWINHRSERFPPDARPREASSDRADPLPRNSFKGKALSRQQSLDSIKDDGKLILSGEEANHDREPSAHNVIDCAEKLEKVPDSSVMSDADQESMVDSKDRPSKEDGVDHLATSSVEVHAALPQPASSEPPKILPSQQILYPQSSMPAVQPPVVETPVGPSYPITDPGPGFLPRQNHDIGLNPFAQPQALPPFQGIPSALLPSYPQSTPESTLGYRPQFSFLLGPRADPPPPPGNAFPTVQSSLSVDHHPAWPPLPHSYIQPNPAAHLMRPQVSSFSSLNVDRHQVQRPPPFEGSYMNSMEQSTSTLPPEPPLITPQGFHGSVVRDDLSASTVGFHYTHQSSDSLGRTKLPLPAHYSPLTFTSSRKESSMDINPNYDSSFAHGHRMGQHGLPNIPSSSVSQTGELTESKAAGPPLSDQYDPLFDSIEPPSGSSKAHLSGSHHVSKLENDEFGETEAVGAVEDESPVSPVDCAGKEMGEVEVDQVRSPGKREKVKESKSMKLLKIALANFVKEILKPSWRQGTMSKEAFKTIVKKTVDKVSGSVSGQRLPRSQAKIDQYVESSRRKLTKLVMGYVDKYVKM